MNEMTAEQKIAPKVYRALRVLRPGLMPSDVAITLLETPSVKIDFSNSASLAEQTQPIMRAFMDTLAPAAVRIVKPGVVEINGSSQGLEGMDLSIFQSRLALYVSQSSPALGAWIEKNSQGQSPA